MIWQRLLESRERLAATSLDTWYAALRACLDSEAGPFEQALLGGRLADTPGLAFLAGYQAALRALWPAAPASLGALCITEQRSLRPADLRTRLDDLALSGRKDYVTAAGAVDWLLVVARTEAPDEPPRLAVGVVRRDDPGVRLDVAPPAPLLPDIAHGQLHLDGARCQRLAGDGWDDYAKPFRSLEDLYVLTAISAWLYGLACDYRWSLRLPLLALLCGCAEVARLSPGASGTHLLLASLLEQQQALRPRLDEAFASAPAELAATWQRDRKLLDLAAGIRARRLEKALAAFPAGNDG